VAESVEFFVPGVPASGGSKRQVIHRHTGKVVTMDDCRRNRDWRAVVALAAREAMGGRPPLDGPLEVELRFVVPRPRVRAAAPPYPTTKPDVLKLARSTEDALSGVLYVDDAQTIELHARKRYGDRPGCEVRARPMAAGEGGAP
jgi:Holliday junction resolvase RusA-like endonuclease